MARSTQELAQAAQRILADEAAQTVLTMMRDAAISRWQQAQTPPGREAAWHDFDAGKRFQQGLQTLADRGVVERITEERASARK